MRYLRLAGLSAALATTLAATGLAHSLEELQGQLRDREKYFQPVGKEASEFTLEDANGRPVTLQDLRGKVVVLHFIYTSCPDVCPLHAERMAEIQEMVNRTPMRELVQFFTITTDPEHDTPEVMRDYGSAHGLDPANWVFLTTTPDQPEDATRKLAERFGHGFTETEDGYQIHGVVTHVIDREGQWQANFPRPEIRADQPRPLHQRARERPRETARAQAAELLGDHSWLVLTVYHRRRLRLCPDL
jgi:protein SCO1/2